jgi:hypothetical protein
VESLEYYGIIKVWVGASNQEDKVIMSKFGDDFGLPFHIWRSKKSIQ